MQPEGRLTLSWVGDRAPTIRGERVRFLPCSRRYFGLGEKRFVKETRGLDAMTSSWQKKIVSLGELLAVLRTARAAGKTIVQCHGCFDLVHPGHIRYLEFARQQGDVLVVTLTGDSDIAKGDQRPYIPQELRAENLAALLFVDYVHIDPHPTAEHVLTQIQPDVYVKGREYERSTHPDFLTEKSIVESHGGRMIFSSGEIVFSSTALLEHVPQTAGLHARRLQLVTRRHGITLDAVEHTLSCFRNLTVLVVGDAILDRYVFCDALDVASESPMMNLIEREERLYVGGAAIVARHVAALGGHAFLLTSGGRDDSTRTAHDVLDKEGVHVHFIESRPALVEKTRFLADDAKLFKVERGQRHPLDSVTERHAAVILEQQSKVADAVIFCDFGYGMITESLLSRILPTLRQNVPILAADVSGGRATMLNFQNVDLLCPTEREIRSMLNDYASGLHMVAWAMLQRTQARHIIVTLDKRGMVVFERPSQDRSSPDWAGRLKGEPLPSFASHPLDKLGCGDALLAGATLALAAGASPVQSAYIGNAAAAIEIALLGNHPVDMERLRQWLSVRPEWKDLPDDDPHGKRALKRGEISDPDRTGLSHQSIPAVLDGAETTPCYGRGFGRLDNRQSSVDHSFSGFSTKPPSGIPTPGSMVKPDDPDSLP